MIYGVEWSTDKVHPGTKIKRFTSENVARKWAGVSGGFAFPDAADESLPPSQSNFHRKFRQIFRMPSGWRKPSKATIGKDLRHYRHSSYDRSPDDVIADAIAKDGTEIK